MKIISGYWHHCRLVAACLKNRITFSQLPGETPAPPLITPKRRSKQTVIIADHMHILWALSLYPVSLDGWSNNQFKTMSFSSTHIPHKLGWYLAPDYFLTTTQQTTGFGKTEKRLWNKLSRPDRENTRRDLLLLNSHFSSDFYVSVKTGVSYRFEFHLKDLCWTPRHSSDGRNGYIYIQGF